MDRRQPVALSFPRAWRHGTQEQARSYGKGLLLACAAVTALVLAAPGVHAQSSAPPITLTISSAPGGGNDTYGRLAARHLGRFLPGNPTIVPKNMPGAGGVVQGNYLYNVAPRDGSTIGIMQAGPAFDALLGYKKVQFDPRRFNWLLSLANLDSLVIVWHTSPVKTAKDLFEKKLIMGASSGDSLILPNLLNELMGAKIQVVKGYPGVTDTFLAMERGEVQGLSTYWDTLKSTQGDLLRDRKVRVVMQISLTSHPQLKDVPLVMDFIKDDVTRGIMELILARQAVGRPLVAPPGVPTEKVEMFRHALEKMAADKQFLAEAKKIKIEINVTSGAELAALVDRAYKTPPDVVKKTVAALKQAGG